MAKISHSLFRRATIAAVFTAVVAAPASAQDMTPAELVEALQGGGLIAYIRHATTEKDYADQVTADPLDCSTQRTLSEEGWREAKAIGEGFRESEIPVGEVISSQYCRAWQTADLAFGRYEPNPIFNFLPAEEYTDEEMQQKRDRQLPVVLAPIEEGNRVIVGHDDPFEALTGIYPEPMGVTYVLRPAGDDVEVLGSIPPDYWTQ